MKAIVKEIHASSRASVKVGDSYYTVEYSESRELPEDLTEEEIAVERTELWDTVNGECDGQIEDILKTFGKQRR